MKEINFAANLKALRIGKQMKQHELAKILNVDKRTISAWENEVCEPSLTMLAKLCEIFDETFDNILT